MSTNSQGAGPRPDDHVIVVLGGTGDLARRKLLPGLFHLHVAGLLPREYRVIGSAPESFALTDEQFRAHARGGGRFADRDHGGGTAGTCPSARRTCVVAPAVLTWAKTA
jgi:Glucose-6-phosphate dehydrogenase, NAD binding domain